MPRVITTDDLRTRLGRELDALKQHADGIYVTKRGRLTAVLLDVDRHAELMDRLDYLEDSLAALEARQDPAATTAWTDVR
jgi:hypothetical protein